MKVYMVQHGKPLSKEEDPDRPLSEEGKSDLENLAAFLNRAGIQVEEVFHSGKTRAAQSAEIVSFAISPNDGVKEKQGLAPKDDVGIMAKEIEQRQTDLVIVGHLPHLEKLASFLITGDESTSVVKFQQGGLVCLEYEENTGWKVGWMVVPEIIAQ